MKRIYYVCSFFILAFLVFSGVSAAAYDVGGQLEKLDVDSQDYKEIVELRGAIESQVKSASEMVQGDQVSDGFKIEFESAQKIYVDTDIFALETTDADAIQDALNAGNYVWLLPVIVGGDKYQVTIARGLPLRKDVEFTDDEIQRIKANEGKWCISSVGCPDETIKDYEDIIGDMLDALSYDKDITQISLCGGLPFIHYPVAVVMSEGKADLVIPTVDLEVAGTEEQIQKIKPKSAAETDNVYLYEGIMDAVNQMEPPTELLYGGSHIVLPPEPPANNGPLVIALVALLLLSSSFVVYRIVRKRKNAVPTADV